jgi:hypothetical protein
MTAAAVSPAFHQEEAATCCFQRSTACMSGDPREGSGTKKSKGQQPVFRDEGTPVHWDRDAEIEKQRGDAEIDGEAQP